MIKYHAIGDLDDKDAPKDSVAPSDNIEKSKDNFVSPSAEIEKISKEYTKTQKATNDLVHPKMSPTLSFSGMYQKPFIYHRNSTNSQ